MNTTTKPAAPAEPYPTLEQRITHLVNTHYSEKVAGDMVKAQEALDEIVKMVRGGVDNVRAKRDTTA